jgi:hypothetical protein
MLLLVKFDDVIGTKFPYIENQLIFDKSKPKILIMDKFNDAI